jgi:hypothetical protein
MVAYATIYRLAFVRQMQYVGGPARSYRRHQWADTGLPAGNEGVWTFKQCSHRGWTSANATDACPMAPLHDSPHCLPIEKPTEFVATVRSFLEILL